MAQAIFLIVFMLRAFPLHILAVSLAMASGLSLADTVKRDRDHVITQRHVLDWVPINELTQAQRSALPPGSCGAYIAPVRTDADATTFPDQAPLRALSDQTIFDQANPDGAKVLLLGDVEVLQGFRQIKAEQAELNEATGQLIVEGPLEVREPGILMLGDRAVVDSDDDVLLLDNGVFVIHPANTRGAAKRLTKNGLNTLVLEEASFTRCEPQNNAWVLKGSKITLDFDARQGYARNVYLQVAGVPMLYFPYFRFPLGDERLTGFLAPAFEFGDEGSTISVPYYFNLAPNYDLLWTLHSIEQHGLLNEFNARHLSSHFNTQLNLAYLNSDRGSLNDNDRSLINSGVITETEAVPFKGDARWVVNFDQAGGAGKAWSTEIDVTRVSDIDFFRDFDQTGLGRESDRTVQQRVHAAYATDSWQFSAETLQYQLLSDSITEPYQQLPELVADGGYNWGDWSLTLDNEWIRFEHANTSEATPFITGDRLRLDYGLSYNYEREWGFVKPSVLLKSVNYQLNDLAFVDGAETSQSITAPQLTLDTGLVFERYAETYTQTLEPRLFFFNSPFRDHSALFDLTSDGRDIDFDTSTRTFNFDQVFRNTRFSGGDRIDDANQVSLGLTTRFLSQESGREWFSAALGQIVYFDDRRVTLNNTVETESHSDIAIALRAKPTEQWEASSDLIVDHADEHISSGNFGITYTSAFDNVFDVNYRFVRGASTDTRQVDVSIIAPLGGHQWHWLGHGAYDIEAARAIDLISAIEYDGCCYSVRLGGRRQLDSALANAAGIDNDLYDNQVFFEVHFYGLGSSGNELDTLFEDNIEGYERWLATHRK